MKKLNFCFDNINIKSEYAWGMKIFWLIMQQQQHLVSENSAKDQEGSSCFNWSPTT